MASIIADAGSGTGAVWKTKLFGFESPPPEANVPSSAPVVPSYRLTELVPSLLTKRSWAAARPQQTKNTADK